MSAPFNPMTEFIHPTYGRLICAYCYRNVGILNWVLVCATDRTDLARSVADAVAKTAGARIIWPDSPGLAEIVKLETARDVLVDLRDGWSWGQKVFDEIARAIALIDSGNAGGPTT